MKKFLLLIPVVLLLLWVSITWIIGSGTKKSFTVAVEALNNNLGAASGLTAIAEESYSRGFLSSEAITKITIADKPGGDQPETGGNEIFLKFKAWHGPLMMTPSGMKIGAEYVLVTLDKDRLPDEVRKIVDEGFKGAEPVKLGVFTGFGGKIALDTEIASFASSDAGGASVQFDGFSAELVTNVSQSYAKGQINIGALTVEDKKSKALLSTAEAKGEMDYTNLIMKMTGDGKAFMDFPEIKMTLDGNSYALKELHFDNVSEQNDGKFDMTSKVSIGGFKGPDKGEYAEIIAKMDGKLEVEFSAEGMEVEALKEMAKAQQKLQMTQGGNDEDSESQQQALKDYMVSASSLLQPGYKMKSNIAFTNKKGKSELGLGIEYTGDKTLFELKTIRDLLNALEVALNLQIAKNLIPESMNEQIKPAMGMGFILDKGEAYGGDAILAGGVLKVSGKEHPVLKDMGAMLDMPIPWDQFGIDTTK